MPLKKFRPFTPPRRHAALPDFAELTRGKPVKSLTERKLKTGGRDNYGHISSRWIGGGHKQRYRIVDFRRNKDGVPARVASIEYDPNRSARIALLNYMDGDMGGGLVALKGEYQLGDGALTFSYTTSAEGGSGAFIGLGYEKSL